MKFEPKKYTVSELIEAFKATELRRADEYQRGEVWDKVQKARFIDSLFRS